MRRRRPRLRSRGEIVPGLFDETRLLLLLPATPLLTPGDEGDDEQKADENRGGRQGRRRLDPGEVCKIVSLFLLLRWLFCSSDGRWWWW